MEWQWSLEPASSGRGDVFVATRASGVCVLAPPGVPLNRTEWRRVTAEGTFGWRVATWSVSADEPPPCIDTDRATVVREISTVGALEFLGPEWREYVWQLLLVQVQDARSFGEAAPGELVEEDVVRVGAQAVRWITAELRAAFPEREADAVVEPPLLTGDEASVAISVEDLQRLVQPPPDQMPPCATSRRRQLLGELHTARRRCEEWLRPRLVGRPTATWPAHAVHTPLRRVDQRASRRADELAGAKTGVSLTH